MQGGDNKSDTDKASVTISRPKALVSAATIETHDEEEDEGQMMQLPCL